MKRKIAVILAASIEHFKDLVARNEEQALRRLGQNRAILAEAIRAHDGRIFNTANDALLAEFQSAVEAVRCAVEVQRSLRPLEGTGPERMRYKIGITVGDVLQREGDLLGDGVNVAARLQGLESKDGICVTQSVVEHAGPKLDLRFADLGVQRLRNIPAPVRVFAVEMDGLRDGGSSFAPTSAVRGAALAAIVLLAALGVGWWMWPRAQPAPAVAPPPQQAETAKPAPAPPAIVRPEPGGARGNRCLDILEKARVTTLSREERSYLAAECRS